MVILIGLNEKEETKRLLNQLNEIAPKDPKFKILSYILADKNERSLSENLKLTLKRSPNESLAFLN